MVCEDDPVILKLLQVSLRDTGHELLVAPDGLAGLELIERERPDAILTDVTMPRMTGLELADRIRMRPDLAHIPIVFLSASAQRAHREEEYALHGRSWKTRGADIEARILAIQEAWAGGRVTPAPFSPGGPFLLYGGGTAAAAKRAARLGLGFAPQGQSAELVALYADAWPRLPRPKPAPYADQLPWVIIGRNYAQALEDAGKGNEARNVRSMSDSVHTSR